MVYCRNSCIVSDYATIQCTLLRSEEVMEKEWKRLFEVIRRVFLTRRKKKRFIWKYVYSVWIKISFDTLPTTFNWTEKLLIGIVDIWHSYIPASRFCAHLICIVHSFCSRWYAVWKRWSFVYVYLPTVKMWMSRCRIQETCNWKKKKKIKRITQLAFCEWVQLIWCFDSFAFWLWALIATNRPDEVGMEGGGYEERKNAIWRMDRKVSQCSTMGLCGKLLFWRNPLMGNIIKWHFESHCYPRFLC